jgi:aminopeptidase N
MSASGRTGFLLLGFLLLSPSLCAQSRFREKQDRESPDPRLLARRQVSASVTPASGNPVYDVVDYRLDITAAVTTEDFGGTNTITLLMKSAADSLVFNQLALSIDSVSVNGTARSWSADDAAETMVVRLGGMAAPGETLRVGVAYHRDPSISRTTDRRGYFYFTPSVGIPSILGYTMSEPREARCWMPCVDDPSEKSTASINITVPKGYVAASNGKLLGTEDRGDASVTWKWREGHQIATYLICATISDWTVSRTHFVRAPGDTIPVEYYTWGADAASAAAYLPVVRQMMEALSARFGPYPWDKYGTACVTPFSYGGMEHQSMTTMHRAYAFNDLVVVHELAHQWWGDLVTCSSWPDIWLNESFATYAEALWNESVGGTASLRQYMQNISLFYGSWYGRIYDPESQEGFGLFPSSVYEKGAWVLHMLRGVIGDDAFFGSLALWRERYGEQSASTGDFQAVVEEVSGRPMGWFFSQWIYGAGWPVYSSAFRWGGDTLHVTIAQSQDAGWPTFAMPLPVRISTADADTTVVLADSARLQAFSIPFAKPVTGVVLDPDGWVLKTAGPALDAGEVRERPQGFALYQNYPNPFNPTTTIRFSIQNSEFVTLTVYDLLGREVAVLFDGPMEAGAHQVTFDASRCASGAYLCRLTSGGRSASMVMTLVR